MSNIAIEAMTIEIVDFPMKNGGSFHSFLYVYQRVNLRFPMVFLWFSYGFPMVNVYSIYKWLQKSCQIHQILDEFFFGINSGGLRRGGPFEYPRTREDMDRNMYIYILYIYTYSYIYIFIYQYIYTMIIWIRLNIIQLVLVIYGQFHSRTV